MVLCSQVERLVRSRRSGCDLVSRTDFQLSDAPIRRNASMDLFDAALTLKNVSRFSRSRRLIFAATNVLQAVASGPG